MKEFEMKSQERKLVSICEAVAIVEGLRMLIDRTRSIKSSDEVTYHATIQFLKSVHQKYSLIASTPLTKDQEDQFIPGEIDIQQLQRRSAEYYIQHSMN